MITIQKIEYVYTGEEATVGWNNSASSNIQVCAKKPMTMDITITWDAREVRNATNHTRRCAVTSKEHGTAPGE